MPPTPYKAVWTDVATAATLGHRPALPQAALPRPRLPDRPAAVRLARIQVQVGVSIVIPTYREVENIPHILARLGALRRDGQLDLEVIFMDDDSRDGSVEAVASAGLDWARMVVRHRDRGLSAAVLDGFRLARHPVLVCMDCDLSHPPERILPMILALDSGQQMVLGSRYVPGGSTDDDWGVLRWLNSRIATLLARPLTRVRDPMSGFFVMRAADFRRAAGLNPIGYKVALELIAKCGFDNVGEVPIAFADRRYGQSKLTLSEQLKYLRHVRRLYLYKFGNTMYLLQFLAVGLSGAVVNLAVLSALLHLGLPEPACLAGGIGVSVVTNFLLNRRFAFSYARSGDARWQFLGFLAVASLGMTVNFVTALMLRDRVPPDIPFGLQIAAVGGIVAGTVFNFLGSRYVVFRKRHVRPPDPHLVMPDPQT